MFVRQMTPFGKNPILAYIINFSDKMYIYCFVNIDRHMEDMVKLWEIL